MPVFDYLFRVLKVLKTPRSLVKKASYKIRKFAKFGSPHTGLQPPWPGYLTSPRYMGRARRAFKRGSWQLKKMARFTLHRTRSAGGTGSVPQPIIQNSLINFIKRRRSTVRKLAFKFKKLARFKTWNTGKQTTFPGQFYRPTRVRKAFKTSWQFKKLARFTLLHTRSSGHTGVITPVTAFGFINYIKGTKKLAKKLSFKLRKMTRFAQWHTGAVPGPKQQVWYLKHRYTKARIKKTWIQKKKTFFAMFPTLAGEEGDIGGGQPLPLGVRFFAGRVRKAFKQTGFQLRKKARFVQWQTGSNPPVSGLRFFQSRVRKILAPKPFYFRKKASFLQWHTGFDPSVLLVQVRTKRKLRLKSGFIYRKHAAFFAFHTGSVGPVNIHAPWVSCRVGTHSRGDQ